MSQPQIQWSEDDDPAELARFFAANVDPTYVSHGEVEDGRADADGAWVPDLEDVVTREISWASGPEGRSAGARVAVACSTDSDRELLGLALVRVVESSGRPTLAWLDDLVLERRARGSGLGRAMVGWVERELASLGVERVFLECGHANSGAQRFFDRMQFRPTSIVLSKRLGVSDAGE